MRKGQAPDAETVEIVVAGSNWMDGFLPGTTLQKLYLAAVFG
ncbi:MAG: hypothetical protein WAN11_09620 [Syntrophobacteraceae bacterium]